MRAYLLILNDNGKSNVVGYVEAVSSLDAASKLGMIVSKLHVSGGGATLTLEYMIMKGMNFSLVRSRPSKARKKKAHLLDNALTHSIRNAARSSVEELLHMFKKVKKHF